MVESCRNENMRWLALVLFIIQFEAHAEYRAFELVIQDRATGQERTVISTLDPNLYRTYYPVQLTEVVRYRATWRCRGNTSNFQPICAKPEGK